MSTGVVAASAAAVAMYWYLFKQKGLRDDVMEPVLPVEACRNAPDHAPSNWGEALYHVKEVLRYMYNETLGRWHTIDLFVGLAYLSHRETIEYPAADIAMKGMRLALHCSIPDQIRLMLELQEARRYMLYCKGLKLRREEMQVRFWKEHLGAETLTIVKQQPTAGVLRPAYVVINDHALRCVVLCIRGTHSMKDLFTSLAGAAKPHHVVDPDSGRLVLGYSHLGMLAAARWLARQATPVLRMALEASPGYQLRIVGHSMGGGTAALLTMMYRGGLRGGLTATAGAGGGGGVSGGLGPDPTSHAQGLEYATTAAEAATSGAAGPSTSTSSAAAASPTTATASASVSASDPFLLARCVAIACPSVVTLELAAACRDYVTSIVNGTDIVPTFCAASVDKLREDVTRSSWFSEFSRDMRSGVVRALQGGVRGVGTATQWTSRNILQPAVVPFRACYATTTSRKVRRRAGSTVSQSTGAVASAAVAAAATTAAAAAGTTGVVPLDAAVASAPSSPNISQLLVAEQHEQLLLAAGAGGGAAAAAAAAAAVAALDSSGAGLSHCGSGSTMETWGDPEMMASGPARPPGSQSMSSVARYRTGGGASAVDQRAMAEAVQSCMYAVNSAVSAHHHHHIHSHGHLQQSPSDPAFAEALGLLESLPEELGHPSAAAGIGGTTGGAGGAGAPAAFGPGNGALRRSLEALDTADPWRRPSGIGGDGGGGGGPSLMSLTADSLLAGPTAAPLGAGGVSTAMVYGNSLRRRLWPWGQVQTPDGGGAYTDGSAGMPGTAHGGVGLQAPGGNGCLTLGGGGGGGSVGVVGAGAGMGSAAVSSSYSSPCDQEGGGGAGSGGCGVGLMTLPRMDAPDSPGKAKAAGAPLGGVVSGSMAALASTRILGDWLWRGMLFTTCTTPRRAMSTGPAALGSAAAGLGPSRGVGTCGGRMAGRGPGAAGRRSGSGPLLMDVGDGFDDESDPDERGEARERRRRWSAVGHCHGSVATGKETGAGDDLDGNSDSEDVADSADDDDDGDDDDEEEEEGAIGIGGRGRSGDGGMGGGGSGSQSAAAAADTEQQLQAGITAVVAAVTNQASREAVEGPTALLRDENTLAAEDVLREVQEADAAAAVETGGSGVPRSGSSSLTRRRKGGETLRIRERRREGADVIRAGGAGGRPKSTRSLSAARGSGDGAPVAGPDASYPVGLSREASDAALSRGGEDEEAPLSPGGSSTLASPTGGGNAERHAIYTAEYEARLYKRRLYPAGRILHLFPNAVITGRWPSGAAAAAAGSQGAGGGGGSGSSTANAACTNPIDAAAARVSAAQSPYVLYEVQDPQAYSRVRLCRTMVSDHLIPAYLAALDSILSQLEEQQQRAAMDAWERELERERQEELVKEEEQRH